MRCDVINVNAGHSLHLPIIVKHVNAMIFMRKVLAAAILQLAAAAAATHYALLQVINITFKGSPHSLVYESEWLVIVASHVCHLIENQLQVRLQVLALMIFLRSCSNSNSRNSHLSFRSRRVCFACIPRVIMG
jgi:hypothetical protein